MFSEASAQAEWEAVLFLGIFSSLSSFQLTSFLSSLPILGFGHLHTDLRPEEGRPGKGRTHWGLHYAAGGLDYSTVFHLIPLQP